MNGDYTLSVDQSWLDGVFERSPDLMVSDVPSTSLFDLGGLSFFTDRGSDSATLMFDRVEYDQPGLVDQSGIFSSISDVLKSGLTGLTQALPETSKNLFQGFGDYFKKSAVSAFRSTKTGKELEAEARAQTIKGYLTSPVFLMVIFAAMGFLIFRFVSLGKGRR